MRNAVWRAGGWAVVATGLAWAQDGRAHAPMIPPDSEMAQAKSGRHLRLVTPLTSPAGVHPAGWKMSRLSVTTVTEPTPKLGTSALRFGGVADSPGAKGDFTVAGATGEAQRLGLWVHVAEQDNVTRVGVQVGDAEGEAFLLTRDVDWTGWRFIEFDLAAPNLPQAWKQPDRNGRIDPPLRHVNLTWFAKSSGPSTITVNALVASSAEPMPGRPTFAAPTEVEPGQPLRLPVVVPNPGDETAGVEIEYQVQRDSRLLDLRLPDPAHGSDHAAGADNWAVHDGKEVDRGSLTDSRDGTAMRLPWGGGYTELVQYVDLGRPRRITHMAYESGDANWVWKLDVAASSDGENWTDAPGLQAVDIHKKWGRQTLRPDQPFEARQLRLRYHKDGESVNTIATLSRLSVYDGPGDETWELPAAGPVLTSGSARVEVAPRSFEVANLSDDLELSQGAYLVAARVRSGDHVNVLTHRLFVMPEPMSASQQRDARIALNSSLSAYAPLHRRLGIGWVRFENLKWRMVSPEPGRFVYDGLKPWVVDHDGYIEAMQRENIQVLPYLFLCPEWASSAPADAKHRAAYPPRDYEQYGEFVFQTVARYGSKKHDPSVLKTEDRRSGLNLLTVYELWNEPNLNDPSWGHWVGPLDEYFEFMRVGAEAAKRADPSAKVANAGFAGITLGLIDRLRSYTYADGKRPLDFVDVLSVHTYTGAVPPERSIVDTNVNRSGDTEGSVSHEENLRRLNDWRNQHRPDMPIWMTETGYDSGGPRAVPEREQAALNVRNCLMMLGEGVDKIFIYREAGSDNGLYAASGLLRSDGSFKPSWFAIATLLRQLDGAGPIARLPHPNPDVYLYGWKRGEMWTVAAWTIGEETRLEVAGGSAMLTDSFGAVDKIADTASVMLSDMPIYLSDPSNPEAFDALWKHAEAEREQWQQERRRLADEKAYLFDFGSTEHIGATDIGRPRPFTPVVADDIYDSKRGYGFTPRAAERNDDAHWVKNPTQRDSCRVTPDHQFRIDADPGTYRATVHFSPAKDRAAVRLYAGDSEPVELEATRKVPEASVTIRVGNEPVVVGFSAHGSVSFITLVAE